MTAARSDGGQVIVLVALSLAVLLLGVGLAVDTGRLFAARRALQAAADAGAWAGAVALQGGATATGARSAAVVDVQRNGYSAGGSVTVTVNAPPVSGDHVGDSSYVEVVVSDSVPSTFFLGRRTVSARSVGGVAVSGSTSFAQALLALDTGATAAINQQNSGTRTVLGATVHSNSTTASALQLSGSGSFSATAFSAVGGYLDKGSGAFSPLPSTQTAPVPDPLGSLVPPPTTGLVTRADPRISSGTVTLQPGIYPSLTISGGTVTLASGTYIILGGNLALTGGGSVTGNGVVLYTTYTSYPAAYTPGTPCGTVNLSPGTLSLSGPTSGAYYGLILYHDRNCATSITLTVNGGQTTIVGAFYAAKAAVTVNTTKAATITTQIVAGTIGLQGSVQLTIDDRDRTDLPRGGAGLIPSLAE